MSNPFQDEEHEDQRVILAIVQLVVFLIAIMMLALVIAYPPQ